MLSFNSLLSFNYIACNIYKIIAAVFRASLSLTKLARRKNTGLWTERPRIVRTPAHHLHLESDELLSRLPQEEPPNQIIQSKTLEINIKAKLNLHFITLKFCLIRGELGVSEQNPWD
ncbi:hypothetical protein CDL15_Pgr005608 [Punica granatum]|uniref:Uncharacterized protein n=1 Tax=Punica granatum TaxID=22663 RepID=A0A218WGR7_PUNGR|nr:hypothetical protein CDL15_Pgr005608 [Punica granatum]